MVVLRTLNGIMRYRDNAHSMESWNKAVSGATEAIGFSLGYYLLMLLLYMINLKRLVR